MSQNPLEKMPTGCQALIKEKGLKDEHELQMIFVQTIEKYVNSKGRKIVGCDRNPRRGLAPNAAP